MDRVDASPVFEFGRFKLDPHRRELLADGRPIELGGRTFDTLLALVEAEGALVSKGDLMRRIWPDRVVEENNLEFQISTLRKVLGADRKLIRTVVGRGYQFTGDIRISGAAIAMVPVPSRTANLPTPVSELIGREAETRDVLKLVTAHRLVTLTGAGGIGKTRLALETARQLALAFSDGVFVVDFAPLSDGALVPDAIVAVLNLPLVAAAVSPDRIASALSTKQLLLVLDNCEHLVEPAARMAQALLRASPCVSILATSREPLRAEGEYVYRVPPLAVPPEATELLEDVFRHDAVRLFVTRARAAEPQFMADARAAPVVAAICRRLDGLPLAIELAAACVPSLGVDGIAVRLHDRFALLTSGDRTALPRHQTLRATLDWSYELLSPSERVVLRRLAVFAGAFVLDAARAVAADVSVSADDVEHALASLVTRSLVSADISPAVPHYRLLETTRAYALEKLAESGEFGALARRHAEHQCARCERMGLEWSTSPPVDWLAVYGHQIDNIRLALDWAFSPSGDAALGMRLTVASVPLWMHLSLVTECRARVEQAIAHIGQVPSDPRRDMRLFLALGQTILNSRDIGSPDMNVALTKALELAENMGDTEYRLRAMFGLYAYRLNTGDYRGALALAEAFRSVAAKTGDPSHALVGDRLIGAAWHILGDQPVARRYLEPLLSADFVTARRAHIISYQFDTRVVTYCYYARILWLQGFVNQAMHIADGIVDYARTTDHVLSLLFALISGGGLISLFAGALATADHYVRLALDLAAKYRLETWNAWAQCLGAVLVIRRGDLHAGSRSLRAALEGLPEPVFHHYMSLLLGELAEGLGGTGQIAEGLVTIHKALARAERTEDRWLFPELLRRKGELLVLQGASGGEWFGQALDWARRQGALSLELRCAMSLARFREHSGLPTEARKVLAPVYRRFTEGFDTADLVSAKALLDALPP